MWPSVVWGQYSSCGQTNGNMIKSVFCGTLPSPWKGNKRLIILPYQSIGSFPSDNSIGDMFLFIAIKSNCIIVWHIWVWTKQSLPTFCHTNTTFVFIPMKQTNNKTTSEVKYFHQYLPQISPSHSVHLQDGALPWREEEQDGKYDCDKKMANKLFTPLV